MKNNYLIGAFVLVIITGAFLYSNSLEKEVMEEGAMEGKAMVAEGEAMKASGDAMQGDAMKAATHDAMGTVGVVLKGGKAFLEEGVKLTPLTAEYVFTTGIKVSLTGKVTRPDGTTTQLKEGESAWQDGSIMTAAEGEAMMKEMAMKGGEAMMKVEGTSGDAMVAMKGDAMVKTEVMVAKPGSYIPYDATKIALASSGKVVLNFRASWCPSCQGLHKDIQANLKNIPSNVTILEVDYDNSADLKKKYGVTYQHTFVQVDANGNQIKKWSGSPTLADLLGQIK